MVSIPINPEEAKVFFCVFFEFLIFCISAYILIESFCVNQFVLTRVTPLIILIALYMMLELPTYVTDDQGHCADRSGNILLTVRHFCDWFRGCFGLAAGAEMSLYDRCSDWADQKRDLELWDNRDREELWRVADIENHQECLGLIWMIIRI